MAAPYRPNGESFWRRGGFRVAVAVIVILVLLWAASEFVIPKIAASIGENKIRNKYPEAADVSVSISAFPAYKILSKDYDSLTVKVSNITLKGVNFQQIELKSSEWPQATFTAVISQEEITRFFSLSQSYVMNPQISVQQGSITASGQIDIGAATVSFSAVGQLESIDGKKIYFRPQDVQVSGARTTNRDADLVRQTMEEYPIFVVREDLPFTITKITPEQEKLVIEGAVDMERALNIQL